LFLCVKYIIALKRERKRNANWLRSIEARIIAECHRQLDWSRLSYERQNAIVSDVIAKYHLVWWRGMSLSKSEEQAIELLARQIKSLARAPSLDPGGLSSTLFTRKALLKSIADHILSAFNADGAAIALQNESGSVTCSASTGRAPAIDTELDIQLGFTAECFRSGKMQICADALGDPRVNTSVCRDLDIRSLIAVPVDKEDGAAIIGVALALSCQPSAFGPSDETILLPLVQAIGTVNAAHDERACSRALQSVLDLPTSIARSYLNLFAAPDFTLPGKLNYNTAAEELFQSRPAVRKLFSALRKGVRSIVASEDVEAFNS